MPVYYLGGPMTGYPQYNFPEFQRVADSLRAAGFDIRSAHEVDYGETEETRGSRPYLDYIKGDLKLLLDCDAMILHGNFAQSSGCQKELLLARAIGMEVFEYCGCQVNIHPLGGVV